MDSNRTVEARKAPRTLSINEGIKRALIKIVRRLEREGELTFRLTGPKVVFAALYLYLGDDWPQDADRMWVETWAGAEIAALRHLKERKGVE